MRKWTKESAQAYIKYAKEKGLTYWSAVDYLKHHKTMHSIVLKQCSGGIDISSLILDMVKLNGGYKVPRQELRTIIIAEW